MFVVVVGASRHVNVLYYIIYLLKKKYYISIIVK